MTATGKDRAPLWTCFRLGTCLGLAVALALPLAGPVLAASGAEVYGNARFGYTVEIPPNFDKVAEADNGDGATFQSVEKDADLLVFGTNLVDGDFATELKTRIGAEKTDGWSISYEKVTDGWASYSGTKGEAIVYGRAIALCDSNAALFRIEYPKAKLKAFDAIVEVMVASLKPAEGCAQTGTAVPAPAQ